MANNVKPGDLAFVVSCEIPENIGAIVQVVELVTFHVTDREDGVMWICTTTGRKLYCRDVRFDSRACGWKADAHPSVYSAKVGILDRHLKPISGLPLEDLVETSLVA